MLSRRGSVFIVSLAVVAGLVAVLATVASTQRSVIRAQINRGERVRARIAAEAAVQRAMAELSLQEQNAPTLQTDAWYDLGRAGADRFLVGSESFRMELIDASSRINLNTATQEQLQSLPLTTEQISALLDYRESNREARIDGAKDEYYSNLSEPYNAKLRRFDTVDEVLQVKGFTPDVLFNPQTEFVNSATITQGRAEDRLPLYEMLTVDSYSAQTTATGQAKLNINGGNLTASTLAERIGVSTQVAQAILGTQTNRNRYARIGDVLARAPSNAHAAILDNVTVNAANPVEGKININTATEEILLTIPGLTPDVVQGILQRQPNGGFTQLSDILSVLGLSDLNVLQQVADVFATSSQSFLVRAIGSVGNASVPIEALIVIENNQPRVKQIRDYPLDNPIERWKWEEEASTEVPLLEAAR